MWIWFFPILFIFHDFEEIVLMENWIKLNKGYLMERFPKLSKKYLDEFNHVTTSSFAAAVWEEFLIVCIVTIFAYITNKYEIWIGLFVAFTLHFIMHCFQAIAIRKYVPALVTSIICLPISIYIIKEMVNLVTVPDLILYSIIGLLIMILNLKFVHKYIFSLSKYELFK